MSRETVTTSHFDVLLCTDDGDDYSSNWFITDLILSLGSVMSSLSWFVFCPFWSFVGLDVHFQANQYCTRTLSLVATFTIHTQLLFCFVCLFGFLETKWLCSISIHLHICFVWCALHCLSLRVLWRLSFQVCSFTSREAVNCAVPHTNKHTSHLHSNKISSVYRRCPRCCLWCLVLKCDQTLSDENEAVL